MPEARSAGTSPASTAASTPAPNPNASTGHPVVTASRRGIAWPPIALSTLTMPSASADAGCAPGQREQDAFDRYLTKQRGASDAQRGPHGVLLLPLQSADEQQRGGVAARDEQHQRGSAEQRQQHAPAVAVQLLHQRLEPRRAAVEVAIVPRLPCAQHRQLRLGLRRRHARLQAADHVPHRLLQTLGVRRAGHPEIHRARRRCNLVRATWSATAGTGRQAA